jgi:cell division protein FtsA
MNHNNFAVGLDIGTTKIVAIVGKKNEKGKIEVMGVGRSASFGVHKGIVNNIAQTINSIQKAIAQAEEAAGVKITHVTVGIAGKHIRSLQHSDYITRQNPDMYITEDDIEDLKNQVKKLVMLPGEEIIHVLPQEYKIDSQNEIIEPVGMHGSRLEANFHVVVGQMGAIRNIVRCVKEAGLHMESLTLEPLASSESVLTTEEKEAGVALIDIGGGTTDLAIFKDNIIRHTCVIPYGGNIITEDIKAGCSIIEKYAEKLKVLYGSAIPELTKESIYVTIPGLQDRADKEISVRSLAKIVNARAEEILNMVNSELKAYGAHDSNKKLIAGLVLTGGGSNLQYIKDLSGLVTGFDTRIGFANNNIANDTKGLLRSPEYSTVIGLLMESLTILEKQKNTEKPSPEPIKSAPDSVLHNLANAARITDDDKPQAIENILPEEFAAVEIDPKEEQKTEDKKKSIGERILDKFKSFLDDNED